MKNAGKLNFPVCINAYLSVLVNISPRQSHKPGKFGAKVNLPLDQSFSC